MKERFNEAYIRKNLKSKIKAYKRRLSVQPNK